MTRADTDGFMAAHVVAHAAGRDRSPAQHSRGEVRTALRRCVALVGPVFDAEDAPAAVGRLEQAAAEWAREGIPLDALLHSVHLGFTRVLDRTTTATLRRPVDRRDSAAVTASLDLLAVATGTITAAYIRRVEGPYRCPTAPPRCTVLAVHIPPRPDRDTGASDRLRAELTARFGDAADLRLSVAGGTVLLPEHVARDLDDLTATLSRRVGTALTVSCSVAERPRLTEVTETAHRLLDVLTRLDYPPGAYRVDRMTLEVQLSRPGPARDHLAAILEPLDDRPELLDLLRIHLANNLNRQLTAETFAVHPNTVDHRLERIFRLTGRNPSSGDGAFVLRSALIARGAMAGGEPTP